MQLNIILAHSTHLTVLWHTVSLQSKFVVCNKGQIVNVDVIFHMNHLMHVSMWCHHKTQKLYQFCVVAVLRSLMGTSMLRCMCVCVCAMSAEECACVSHRPIE